MKMSLLAICAAIAVAGCQAEGIPPPEQSKAPASTSSHQSNGANFEVQPDAMASCDPAAEAVIRWDASGLPDAQSLEVWVVSGGEEKLFAAGGQKGEAKTGPWTRPGTRFVLKNPTTKRALADIVVTGPACQ